jgi:hypothetical protein
MCQAGLMRRWLLCGFSPADSGDPCDSALQSERPKPAFPRRGTRPVLAVEAAAGGCLPTERAASARLLGRTRVAGSEELDSRYTAGDRGWGGGEMMELDLALPEAVEEKALREVTLRVPHGRPA